MDDPRVSGPPSALHAALQAIPRDALPEALGELEMLRAQVWARLAVPPPPTVNGSVAANMTAGELAVIYKVPKSFFYELARQGRIPCMRLGRYVRFNRADVEQALAGRR